MMPTDFAARRLFIALYLDEDVDVLLADLLRGRGFDVETTRDTRNVGKSDDQQLRYAAGEGRVIFTHNRADF